MARALLLDEAQWPDRAACPVRELLDRLGDTWSLRALLRLGAEPLRFRALLRRLPNVSTRMLTVTLRALERDGLVMRHVLDGSPPGVEYRLSALGLSLLPAVQQLAAWATAHHLALAQARALFDARQTAPPGTTVHRLQN